MIKKKQRKKSNGLPLYRLTISGFKSISKESSIEIAPLTILAGANSSGKSSFMQPLLLMKQTMGSWGGSIFEDHMDQFSKIIDTVPLACERNSSSDAGFVTIFGY